MDKWMSWMFWLLMGILIGYSFFVPYIRYGINDQPFDDKDQIGLWFIWWMLVALVCLAGIAWIGIAQNVYGGR